MDTSSINIESIVIFVTTLITIGGFWLQYMQDYSREQYLMMVSTSFQSMVTQLSSDRPSEQLAGAVLCRRFFDQKSELGKFGMPFADEAINVVSSLLRSQSVVENSILRKTLADSLAYAPTLQHADLQRTNMQDAYFGPQVHGAEVMKGLSVNTTRTWIQWLASSKVFSIATITGSSRIQGADEYPDRCEAFVKKPINLSYADFYCADVSSASFKMCNMNDANFYQARCQCTTFRGADLRGVNFYEADLLGANFKEARLTGASFFSARNIPGDVSACLVDGVYPENCFADNDHGCFDPNLVSKPEGKAGKSAERKTIFISRPGTLSIAEQRLLDHVARAVRLRGFEVEQLTRADYVNFGVLAELRRRISGTDGLIILGIPQMVIKTGAWRPGHAEEKLIEDQSLATPWNSIEGGMGIMLGLPILLICDSRLNRACPPGPAGVFSLDVQAEDRLYGPMLYDGPSVLESLAFVDEDKGSAFADDTFRTELNMDNKHFNEWAACVNAPLVDDNIREFKK